MVRLQWADRKEITERMLRDTRVSTLFEQLLECLNNSPDKEHAALGNVLNKIAQISEIVRAEKKEEYLSEIMVSTQQRIAYHKKQMGTPRFTAKNGVKVRSKIEKIIADFYCDHNIQFEYEKYLIIGDELFFVDFYLFELNIWHEHFGLEDEAYKSRKRYKKEKFSSFTTLYTESHDEANIEQVLITKLQKLNVRM